MKGINDIKEMLTASFSDWIQVVDPKSPWTLDNVEMTKDGINPEQVKPHCLKCVVVNQCWFKNEKNKKPEPFGYEKYSNVVLSEKGIQGLYHPNCHCKEMAIPTPTESKIQVECGDGKIDDMFSRKKGLATSWGYKDTDKFVFKKNLINSTLKSYLKGDYKIFKYDAFGFQISIFINFPGINEKEGNFYKRETGFMVYPNGKIQNDTAIGRKWK